MAEKKYLDYTGLQNVAGHVNTRLKTVTTMPVSADNGAVRLYVGTTGTYVQGHTYQYNTSTSAWVDITPTTDISGKADKVSNATNGNLAGLNASGNLTDSGKSPSDFIEKSNTSGLVKNDGSIDTKTYAEKASGNTTADDFVTFDSNGKVADSGINKNIVPSGASSSNKLATANDIPNELSDLTGDVNISNPVNAQILTYNGTSGKWENQTGSGSTSGATFKESIYFANIPTTGMQNGDWYDIKDAFTTDNRFEEGTGIACGAGTDIIWSATDSKWNILTPSGVYMFNGRTGAVTPQTSDYDADEIDYSNSTSGLSATDVQGAIDEINGGKISKVTSATNNNFAMFSSGSIVDSGKSESDFQYANDKMTSADMTDVLTPLPSARGNWQEYSTTEQRVGTWIDGKPLYQKTVDCGALPNNTIKSIEHGISNADTFVNEFGMAKSSVQTLNLPLVNPATLANAINIWVDTTYIKIQSATNYSTYTETYITLLYTKTTN